MFASPLSVDNWMLDVVFEDFSGESESLFRLFGVSLNVFFYHRFKNFYNSKNPQDEQLNIGPH